jgi:hypothetical protein
MISKIVPRDINSSINDCLNGTTNVSFLGIVPARSGGGGRCAGPAFPRAAILGCGAWEPLKYQMLIRAKDVQWPGGLRHLHPADSRADREVRPLAPPPARSSRQARSGFAAERRVPGEHRVRRAALPACRQSSSSALQTVSRIGAHPRQPWGASPELDLNGRKNSHACCRLDDRFRSSRSPAAFLRCNSNENDCTVA